jgi:hypothetical protein
MRSLQMLVVGMLVLAVAGCGAPVHVSLTGPGLHRAVAQGGESSLHFWWLPPTNQQPAARLLLWDGSNVGISDPAATDQGLVPVQSVTDCGQVALAPDHHAFACGALGERGSQVLVQSLNDLNVQPPSLLDESAPLAWSPDSTRLAALQLGTGNAGASCSVVVVNTSLPDLGEAEEQVLLENIPFAPVGEKGASICPVQALAWSPDGARLALSLAASNGVVLEVLALGMPGQPAAIESRHLLPGKALPLVDAPAVSSLFWSSDGQTLAALTGYGAISEDGLFLLSVAQQTTLTGPNLVDTGDGAALAFAPNGRWLAVGAVGEHPGGDNAQMRVFDVQASRWQPVAPMFVNGDTLAWSADSALLAAASVSQHGEVIWNWPSASLNSIVPNQNSASLEQLGWAQDDSALFFALGVHTGGAPFYDEIYAQRFPVPPGATSFAFPLWFLRVLDALPQALVWCSVALLGLIAVALLLVLIERGRSRRRRALILWTPGVGIALLALLVFSYNRLPEWLANLYQPFSARVCQSAPMPCNAGAALSLGTLALPLLLGLLVMLAGVLFTSRKRPLVPGEGLPRPVSRGPLRPRPPAPEPPPLLLPTPIDQQETQELETPHMPRQRPYDDQQAQDW